MKSVFKMEKFAVFGKTKLEKCGFGTTYGLLSLLLKRMFCEKMLFDGMCTIFYQILAVVFSKRELSSARVTRFLVLSSNSPLPTPHSQLLTSWKAFVGSENFPGKFNR